MTIFDISLTISASLPTWPGDPGLVLERFESMDKGAHANVTSMSSSLHLDTHVDRLMILNDGRTVEELPLDVLTGQCYVVQSRTQLTRSPLKFSRTEISTEMKRILFGKNNSHQWVKGEPKFLKDFVAITEDGAEWLVEHGVKLVGVDYLSVAPYGDSEGTHKVLLQCRSCDRQGLNLSKRGSRVFMIYIVCRLKIAGADGAPARAILIQS